MTQEINSANLREMIRNLVKSNPELADNDKKLIAMVWLSQGWDDRIPLYENLCRVNSAESIRRTRAKLVEEGFIEPSADVQAVRKALAKQVRENLKKKPEKK